MNPTAATRYIQEAVTPGSWTGRRCFVVAGGPSLSDFDFTLLKDELTIGVNRAYERFVPTINYSMDADFFSWAEQGRFGAKAHAAWNADGFVKCFLDGGTPYPEDIFRIRRKEGAKDPCFNLNEGIFPGPNSAYGAICLALALGCREIYLLGLDMRGKDGKQAWWHDGYPKGPRESDVYGRAVPYYEKLGRVTAEMGAKVVNLSPASAITAWPRAHWSSVFKTIYIKTYLGFGDNLYMQPFAKRRAQDFDRAYIETPWPQLYAGIPNVRLVPAGCNLNAQAAAEKAWSDWSVKPAQTTATLNFYETTAKSKIESVPERFADDIGCWDVDMSIDVRHEWINQARAVLERMAPKEALRSKKLCIVKQPTFRKEWFNDTRNPKPEHLQKCVDRIRKDYLTVSVANLRDGEEWPDGKELNTDVRLHRQELDIFGTVGLMWLSDLVIGYPSFFVPLAQAMKKRALMIYGGCGKS